MGVATELCFQYNIAPYKFSIYQTGETLKMSSVEERVKKIVAEQLGVKEEEVQASASFV